MTTGAHFFGDYPPPIPDIAALGDAPLDIAPTALKLAALDHPDVQVDDYLSHLQSVLDAAAKVQSPDDLGTILNGKFGYEGDVDHYDDLSNMDMIQVVDRRRGLPVALGILYIHTARSVGWEATGLNFPGHFVIRVVTPEREAYLDPFSHGRELGRGDLDALLAQVTSGREQADERHVQPVPDRDVLLRLQNNAVVRLIQKGDLLGAHQRLRRMSGMAPDRIGLWRELAIISDAADMPGEAVSAAAELLQRTEDMPSAAKMREEMESLLRRCRKRLN